MWPTKVLFSVKILSRYTSQKLDPKCICFVEMSNINILKDAVEAQMLTKHGRKSLFLSIVFVFIVVQS